MSQCGSRETATLRRLILLVFVIGLVGTGTELILLEHTESVWQWVPLAVLGAGLASFGWLTTTKSRVSLRTFQSLMLLFVVSGIAGLVLHFRGNLEFELEMYPKMKGLTLFWQVIKGATPALAPGMMIQLGLVGLAATYRHPIVLRSNQSDILERGEIE